MLGHQLGSAGAMLDRAAQGEPLAVSWIRLAKAGSAAAVACSGCLDSELVKQLHVVIIASGRQRSSVTSAS